MPRLLFAYAATDAAEARRIRTLATNRHAPGNRSLRTKLIACG